MGLQTFSDFQSQPPPRPATYVVDTSFVLAASAGSNKNSEKRNKQAYAFKRYLLENKYGLVFIGTVRNEALHRLRQSIFSLSLDNQLRNFPELLRCYRDAPRGEQLKEVLKAGYVTAFQKAYKKGGVSITQEMEAIFFGCTYISTDEMKPRPSWDEIPKLMATYGLDSSDALILNFAVSQRTFHGLITMDSDFRFCSDIPDFRIVLPSTSNLNGVEQLR